MKRACRIAMFAMLVAVVLVASLHGPAIAQAPETSTPSTLPANDGPTQSSTLKPGTEILSDTMGVDFSGYLQRLHDDLQRNWDKSISAEAHTPENKKGVTGIRFTILPNGKIGSMTLEIRSGDVALDRAAWYAITAEGRFPRLPTEFHGPLLALRVCFFYNIPLPPAK